MSTANAAARKRRAGGASIESSPPAPSKAVPTRPGVTPGAPQATGLSLQQVISLVDTRLVKLETFMRETQAAEKQQPVVNMPTQAAPTSSSDMDEFADEVNDRFDMLAVEIANLKDIVLKLQSYTMEVNKTLMEERVSILSDMGTQSGMMTFSTGEEPITLDIVEN